MRALDVARSTAASGAAQSGADAGACAAAMRLMCSVLGWGFRGGGSAAAVANGTAIGRRANAEAAAALRPGQAWADVLLPEGTTDWLLALLPALRGPAAGGALAQQARALVVAFCSLAGDVFPKAAARDAAAPAAAVHCARMLRAAAPWVAPAGPALRAALAGDEAELVDGCRCGRGGARLAGSRRGHALLVPTPPKPTQPPSSPPKPHPPTNQQTPLPQRALGARVQPQARRARRRRRRACRRRRPPRVPADGGAHNRAARRGRRGGRRRSRALGRRLHRAAAGCLVERAHTAVRVRGARRRGGRAGGRGRVRGARVWGARRGGAGGRGGGRARGGLRARSRDHAASGWPSAAAHPQSHPGSPPRHTYLHPPHHPTRQDATEEEDVGAGAAAQEEWLSRAAALARAAPAAGLGLLAERLAAKQGELAAAAAAGGDVSEPLEQLCWLARMSAHALADTAAGETPLPPEALLLALGGGGPGAAAAGAAVERLSCALLELAGLCLNAGARAAGAVSPRLMEVALWGAARWADTYLFPEEDPLLECLEARFGAAGGGGQVALEMLAAAANQCLTGYPGEAELHGVVTGTLLPALVRRRACAARLLGCDAWRQLGGAFAARDALLSQGLPQKQQRALARSLCAAAAAFDGGGGASGNGRPPEEVRPGGGHGEGRPEGSYPGAYLSQASRALTHPHPHPHPHPHHHPHPRRSSLPCPSPVPQARVAAAAYVAQLMEPVARELAGLAADGPQKLAATAERADVQLQASWAPRRRVCSLVLAYG
jgi:hypothetical protein